MSRTTSEDLQDLAKKYAALKQTSAALKNDSFHALLAMDHDDLARIAFDALETAEAADTAFGYSIAMLEAHVESSDDCQCGWIISQSQPDGSFNKHCKTLGGLTRESAGGVDLRGDMLVFNTWKDAATVLKAMHPDMRPNFRIYPAVLFAAKEPRTTPPRGEIL